MATLRAAGDFLSDEALAAFTQAHPEVMIQEDGRCLMDEERAIQDWLTGNGGADLRFKSVNSSFFKAARDKGYLAAFTGREELEAYVASLYPVFAQEAWREGELIAIPLGVGDAGMWGYNTALGEALSVTTPGTFQELAADREGLRLSLEGSAGSSGSYI